MIPRIVAVATGTTTALVVLVLSTMACGARSDLSETDAGRDAGGVAPDGGGGAEDGTHEADAAVCTPPVCPASTPDYCFGACRTASACAAMSPGKISCGGYTTCAVDRCGTLKCWGAGLYGGLGDGSSWTWTSTPVAVGLSDVTWLGLGVDNSCAVAGGAAYCWGLGDQGALGNGGTGSRTTPTLVSALSWGVSRIASGYQSACALLTTGAIDCWGFNQFGQLGDGTVTERHTPVATGITSGATDVSVSAGHALSDHACAVVDGGAFCWGEGGIGQRGDGTFASIVSSPVPVQGLSSGVIATTSTLNYSCAATATGTVECWGRHFDETSFDNGPPAVSSPVAIPVTNVVGVYGSCALLQSGAVVCWGDNTEGSLGDGTGASSLSPVTALSSGASALSCNWGHCCALMTDGKAVCWGNNTYGQVGNGVKLDPVGQPVFAPVAVVGF